MRDGFEYMLRAFGIQARSLLHVGAHEGQERQVYYDYGAEKAVFVEPIPTVFERLKQNISPYPGFEAVRAVCSDTDGEKISFNVASNEESSSILDLGRHSEFFPDIRFDHTIEMSTRTIDSLVEERFPHHNFNVLVLDTQGAELKILKGAAKLLGSLDAIYTEVNEVPLYHGSATLLDLMHYLQPLGYGLKWLTVNKTMFGDGLFVRNGRPEIPPPAIEVSGTNIALGKPVRQSSDAGFTLPGAGVVNGKRTGSFGFHTLLEGRPWIEIDLEREYPVSEILVFNRLDVCAHRARALQVSGRKAGGSWELIHDQRGRPFGGIDGYPLRIDVSGRSFDAIRLELAAEDFFHLDEVEVYSMRP